MSPNTPAEPTATVASDSALERGRGPRPGLFQPPFLWSDFVGKPPPRRMRQGEGAYVVWQGTETGVDTRLNYLTIVTVDPGLDPDSPLDDVIRVESRFSCEPRFLLAAIHRQQAAMSRWTQAARERHTARVAKERVAIRGWPTPLARAAGWLVRQQGLFGLWLIALIARFTTWSVEVPDRIYASGYSVWATLYDRLGRRSLRKGLRDPANLTTEQKGVILTMSIALLVGSVIILNNIIPVFLPSLATPYRDLLTSFTLGLATAVVLPFPPSELLVIPPWLSAGVVAAFVVIVFSKMVGAWFVYFIGDELHDMIARQTRTKPRTKRIVEWMNQNAGKYGAPILGVFMATPFLPDTLSLYVFAVSGMRFRGYMLAVLVGSALRYGGVLAVLVFFGEGQLRAWLG